MSTMSPLASSPALNWDTASGFKGDTGFTSSETLPHSPLPTTNKSWYILRFRAVESYGDLNTILHADILCVIDPTEPISTCVDRLKSQVMTILRPGCSSRVIAGTFLRIPRPGKASLKSVAMGLYELVVYLREQPPVGQPGAWAKPDLFGDKGNNDVYVYFGSYPPSRGGNCSEDEEKDDEEDEENEVRRVLEWRERVLAESNYLGNRTIEKRVDVWGLAWSVGFWGVGLMMVFGVSSVT